MVGLLFASMMLSSCVEIADADTPSDAGTAPSRKPKHKKSVNADSTGPGLDGAVIGSGGIGSGRFGDAPECMSPDDAMRRAQQPGHDPSARTRERQVAIEQSPDVPDCPTFIWTWVGAGHGSRPVGNVTAPFSLPETRKTRRKSRHACCYLIPSSPGNPAG
jgi:hypothetical protein